MIFGELAGQSADYQTNSTGTPNASLTVTEIE